MLQQKDEAAVQQIPVLLKTSVLNASGYTAILDGGKVKMKLRNKYLPFIFFGLVIFFFSIRGFVHEKKLKQFSKFTIGRITEISFPVEGGPMAEYTFQVNGKTFKGVFSIPSREKIRPEPQMMVNDKFLVKFFSDNPSIN